MTGNKNKFMKILRAVMITASLLWAGTPVITAEEINTEQTLWKLVQTTPIGLQAKAALSITGTNKEIGYIYIYGEYETYKNISANTTYYKNYYKVKAAYIKPATQYAADGEYYGIATIGIKDSYTNQTYTGVIHVGSRYAGDQRIMLSTEQIPRSQPAISLSQTTITITNWGIYDQANTGNNDTTEAVNNIAEQLQADPEVIQGLTDTATQNNQITADAIEAEETITDAAQQNINAINPDSIFNTEFWATGKLQKSLRWIRNIHTQTIDTTQIGNIIGITLILGLAAYMIGRRGG